MELLRRRASFHVTGAWKRTQHVKLLDFVALCDESVHDHDLRRAYFQVFSCPSTALLLCPAHKKLEMGKHLSTAPRRYWVAVSNVCYQ